MCEWTHKVKNEPRINIFASGLTVKKIKQTRLILDSIFVFTLHHTVKHTLNGVECFQPAFISDVTLETDNKICIPCIFCIINERKTFYVLIALKQLLWMPCLAFQN
jgi:hypothetical protein